MLNLCESAYLINILLDSCSTEMVIIEGPDFPHSKFLLPDLWYVLHYFFSEDRKDENGAYVT